MIWLFAFICLFRSVWWIFIFSKLVFHKDKIKSNGQSKRVSVLICVKDNAANLDLLLNSLQNQTYSNFEIIVIDDFSKDEIKSVLAKFNLPHIMPDYDIAGKKAAVLKGVSVATGSYILTIDSDCLPHSSEWIETIIEELEGKTVILGYSPFYKKNTFVHLLQNYENAYIGMQYLSYAKLGIPYMGVGRNLLFDKKEFLDKKPFENNMNIASGDDDFIVQAISNGNNTGIALNENSFTYSHAQTSLKKYIKQKVRHISTANRYSSLVKILLTFFGLLHILFYLVLFSGIILIKNVHFFGLIYLCFMLMMMSIQYPVFKRLKNTKAWLLTPVMDFALAFVYFFLSPYTIFTKNKSWN